MSYSNEITNQPKAILTMGLPASGKSYTIKKHYSDFQENAVLIDPDEIKKTHPDYDPKNVQPIHSWSKKIAKQKMLRAIANEENMIIDGTGTNSEKMVKWIKDLQAQGYTTEIVYVKVSMKTSLKRNRQRERFVPEEIIREKAEFISTSFDILSSIADEITVIDNN